MGIFGGSSSNINTSTQRISSFQVNQSSYGAPIKLVFGTAMISAVLSDYVDFTAVVAVFKDPAFGNELFVPCKDSAGEVELKHFTDLSTDGENGVKTFVLDDVIIPLVMEISYPANVDYSERKKMYFRFEIFNEKYELKDSGS
jgi:hypothetical protein